ncbi:MAG: glycoside hydrolase family 104 protein [Cyanobacteria bacterium P01_A01_bin.116]
MQAKNSFLQPSNLIYRTVFDLNWVSNHIPINWLKILRTTAIRVGVVFLLLPLPISLYAEGQRRNAVEQKRIADDLRKIAEEKTLEAEQQREDAIQEQQLLSQILLGPGKRSAKQDLDVEVRAFLDMLAWSLGTDLNDYKLIFNGEEFDSFADHPRQRVCTNYLGQRTCGDAAGRYQIVSTTWDDVGKRIVLDDFTPESQDKAAVNLLEELGAIELLKDDEFERAIAQMSYIWPSLPTIEEKSRYGFKISSMEELKTVYGIYYSNYLSELSEAR